MFDRFFTSKVHASNNRKSRKHSEEVLEECRDLFSMETGMRKDAYCALKQDLYHHREITPAQQLFVDKIDSVFTKHARKFSKSDAINADIDRIQV